MISYDMNIAGDYSLRKKPDYQREASPVSRIHSNPRIIVACKVPAAVFGLARQNILTNVRL
jgi:hypothetical protein